jgi:hypothetical protein
MELALVPASSCARLLHEYSLRSTTGGNYLNHYAAGDPEPTLPLNIGGNKFAHQNGPPFGHLLNFFRSAAAQADPTQAPNNAEYAQVNPTTSSSNYHRLFDLVRVPSRFSGTDDVLDPAMFQNVAGFAAPFNRLYKQREPGKVNLNSVLDDPIAAPTLQGLFNSDAAWSASNGVNGLASRMLASRRGYPAAINIQYDAYNPDLPTIFANPFRSPGQSYVVPIEGLRRRSTGEPRAQVEASFLRPVDPASPAGRPLFSLDNTGSPAVHTDQNAYFRYQALQKLGGNVTTHSNVFAVWVTVGYFEVEPGPVDGLHPDGFYLKRELGIDNGTQERHRVFAIIDRSIPVGFRRGQNLNSDRTILVERIIE